MSKKPEITENQYKQDVAENAPAFTKEQRFQIMAHLISRIDKGIYVEPMNYRPIGLEGEIDNVIFPFFVHVPIRLSVVQNNQEMKPIACKKTFIFLFVDPPEYSFIRDNKDFRVEVERFSVWKREILTHPIFKKYADFCEEFEWSLKTECFDEVLYSTIRGLTKFNGM